MELPVFPTTLSASKKFPYPEGEQWEYKAATLERIKLYKTICAMLNASGGYIVIGVRDDLTVCGIGLDPKKYDVLALQIDDIWHCSQIVLDTGEHISPTAVKIEQKEVLDYRLAVITVVPEEGKKYKLKNGEFWVRLSASNYCVAENQLYEPHAVQNMIKQRETQILREARAAESRLKNEYSRMLRQFQQELTVRRRNETILFDLLEAKILQEKSAADAARPAGKGWRWAAEIVGVALKSTFSCLEKTVEILIDAPTLVDVQECDAQRCGVEKH